MTAIQKQKALDWFNSHLSPICPSCQKRSAFNILDQISTPTIIGDGVSIQIGGPFIPLVGLSCSNCANLRFFSAVMMGIEISK